MEFFLLLSGQSGTGRLWRWFRRWLVSTIQKQLISWKSHRLIEKLMPLLLQYDLLNGKNQIFRRYFSMKTRFMVQSLFSGGILSRMGVAENTIWRLFNWIHSFWNFVFLFFSISSKGFASICNVDSVWPQPLPECPKGSNNHRLNGDPLDDNLAMTSHQLSAPAASPKSPRQTAIKTRLSSDDWKNLILKSQSTGWSAGNWIWNEFLMYLRVDCVFFSSAING